MKTSRLLALVLFLFTTLLLPAKPFVLVHASDPHFLSPELVEDYGYLEKLAMVSDGKDLHQTHLILEAFVKEMLVLQPDAILLSGDLTLNGAKESHKDLSSRLRVLLDAGIPVYVITGNHDVRYTPYKFLSNGVMPLEKTGGQFFEDTWWDFGFGSALYQDRWTNSYIAKLSDKLWLLAIDSNTGTTGSIRSTTLVWLEEALKDAEEQGVTVISTTHQNLFVHNESFTFGYVLNNAKALETIYRKHGVFLNLTGHLHTQSILEKDGIVEIAVSSLVDTPLQYGILTIADGHYDYHTKEINQEELQETARVVFDACTRNKLKDALSPLEEEERKVLSESAEILNRGYFKGSFDPIAPEALQLWKNHPEISFGRYLLTIYQTGGKDQRVWTR